jgi:hypothetical protein
MMEPMRGRTAAGLGGALTLGAAMAAAAQGSPFPMQRIADRSALCSMEGPSGPCIVVGRARVGVYRVEVVRPREVGSYLGDETLEWNLYFESAAGRWGTLQPIHSEATVCTGEGYERMGGHDSFVLDSLRSIDLVGDRRPELVVRFRTEDFRPPLVMICVLDGGEPRCTYPVPFGRLARDPGGIRVGDQVIPAP